MEDLRKILAQVKEGRMSFQPESPARDDMAAFQPVAKALLHAKQMGYLEDCHAIKENVTGSGYYASVMLRGGLSYAGEMFLSGPRTAEQSQTKQPPGSEDVIDLKPNFFGLGVNLNALWRRVRCGKT